MLLESIVHIHGLPRLTRALNQLRETMPEASNRPLIKCNCEERVKSKWEEAISKNKKDGISASSAKQQYQYIRAPGHKCISTELINLLITGKLEKNADNDSASNLGFGLLSVDDIDEIGKPNANDQSPPKPIWLVKGASSYSILWNSELMSKNENIESSREGQFPFHLTYWNSWYDPAPTKFDGKIIPDRKPWNKMSLPLEATKSIKENESHPIRKEEINAIVAHPEDQKYYKEFHRWRFCLSNDEESNTSSNIKWTSFFRLTKREKNLVEMKMAPQINLAIWKLWPGSDIEWKPSAKLLL